MKKYIYLFFGIAFLLSCSEEKAINKLVKEVSSGGALRVLEIDNNLEVTDMASTYRILLEAQTAKQGTLLKEIRVKVGGDFGKKADGSYQDVVKPSLFQTIPAAEFNKKSESTHKLPVGEFKATLQQLADHLKKTQNQLSHSDVFVVDFDMVLTDNKVYNANNSGSDVVRTGRFSYFNSQFHYRLAINAKQTLITSVQLSSKMKVGRELNKDVFDTLFIVFNGGTKQLASQNPFFQVTPLGSSPSDKLGTVGAVALKEVTTSGKKRYDYYFRYTPSDVQRDTISFVIAGAATYDNVPMDNPDTLKNIFIVDNLIKFDASQPQVLVDGDSIKSVAIDFDFGEPLKTSKDTIRFSVTSSSFDNIVVERPVVGKKVEKQSLSFTPRKGNARLKVSAGTIDFQVNVTKAKDNAGNAIDQQVSFSLFN